jgi:hypothetical protein
MKELLTTASVIDSLGGNAVIAERYGVKPKTVWYWRDSGLFPANTYLAITKELHERGFSAPTSLWPMKALKEDETAA